MEATAAMTAAAAPRIATMFIVSSDDILEASKMKLYLKNFRRYDDTLFDIKDGITKITGESGTGKSTIFEAIYWCLYGKVTDVAPRPTVDSNGKVVKPGQTQVRIEMNLVNGDSLDNVCVERQGKNGIALWINEEHRSGAEAQSLINEIFGTHDMFMMTSYLRAETMHKLIASTPSEKRELTSLLFPGASKYDTYKEKLIALRRNDEQNMLQINTELASLSASISTLERSNPWIPTYTPLDITVSESSINTSINTLKKERDTITSLVSQYELLKRQISSLPDTIDVVPLQERLDAVNAQIFNAVVSSKGREIQIEQVSTQIKDTEAQIESLCTEIGRRMDEREATSLIGTINELQSIGDSLESLSETYNALRKECDEIFEKQREYEESREAIEYNRKLEDILECPSCHVKLRHAHELEPVTTDTTPRPVKHNITVADLNRVYSQVQHINDKRGKMMKNITKYEDILSKVPFLKNKELATLKERLSSLPRLYKQLSSLRSQLQALENDKREYISQTEHASLSAEKKDLTSKIQHSLSIQTQRQSLSTHLANLELQNPWIKDDMGSKIPTLDDEIANLQTQLMQLKEEKRKASIISMYGKYKTDRESALLRQGAIQKRLNLSHSLESVLANVYQQYVGNKLSEIECDICELGKIFFDDTMNITLTPGKESSTGVIRPSFDIKIEYDGIEYTDVKAMSTGERKRLSLVLMIILTAYTNGKIMLLDEALNSVGMEMRGIIMKELEKLHIPIMITSHDDIIGGYQNELKLDDI